MHRPPIENLSTFCLPPWIFPAPQCYSPPKKRYENKTTPPQITKPDISGRNTPRVAEPVLVNQPLTQRISEHPSGFHLGFPELGTWPARRSLAEGGNLEFPGQRR